MDGVTGLANTSDIAVDDFQLNPGACPAGIEGKKNVVHNSFILEKKL